MTDDNNLDFTPTEDELLDEEDSKVVLVDDEGKETEFDFLDLIELDGKEYAVLLAEEDDTVTILELQTSEDGETDDLFSVEDDSILEKVFDIFKDRFKDVFDFDEEK